MLSWALRLKWMYSSISPAPLRPTKQHAFGVDDDPTAPLSRSQSRSRRGSVQPSATGSLLPSTEASFRSWRRWTSAIVINRAIAPSFKGGNQFDGLAAYRIDIEIRSSGHTMYPAGEAVLAAF